MIPVQKQNTRLHSMCVCLLFTFLCFFAVHAYGFLNSTFSHDSLTVLYAGYGETRVKLALGRFLVPLYRILFRDALALPWVTGILGTFFIGASVFLISDMFRIKTKTAVFLISGVMCVNPTVYALVATYCFEFDADMLALFLAVFTAWLWSECRCAFSVPVGSLCLAASVALYQSYVSVAVVLIMLSCLFSLQCEKNRKETVKKGLWGILIVLCAGVIYYISYYLIVCPLTGSVPTERTDVFAFSESFSDLFFNTYKSYFKEQIKIFPRPFAFSSSSCVAFLHILFIASLCITSIKNKTANLSQTALSAIIVALLPFGMNMIYSFSRGFMHDLMTYSLMLFYVGTIISAEHLKISKKLSISFFIKIAVFLMAAVLIYSGAINANKVYLKKHLDEKSTFSTMTRIISDMEECNGYEYGKTPVAFVGKLPSSNGRTGFEDISGVTGLSENADITYYATYYNYFTYILDYPIVLCPEETASQLAATPEFLEMPSYPKNGYIKHINGTVVVKLGQ